MNSLLGQLKLRNSVKMPKVKAAGGANTNVDFSHDGGIFVASAGLLPVGLFVFPSDGTHREQRLSAISDAAQSARTKTEGRATFRGEQSRFISHSCGMPGSNPSVKLNSQKTRHVTA